MEKYIGMIFKYIGFGLMFVILGIIGVGVLLFYLMKKILDPTDYADVETDDWGEMEDKQPNTL